MFGDQQLVSPGSVICKLGSLGAFILTLLACKMGVVTLSSQICEFSKDHIKTHKAWLVPVNRKSLYYLKLGFIFDKNQSSK